VKRGALGSDRVRRLRRPVVACCALALLLVAASAAPGGPRGSTAGCAETGSGDLCRVDRGDATTSLAGTWRFRVGDDRRWAAPDLDDRTGDWAPLQVPGPWGRQGHRDLVGFAWYRLDLVLDGEAAEAARTGRLGLRFGDVDSSYELFVGGQRVGGVGGVPPHAALMYDRHAVFAVPASAVGDDGRLAIALRVWHSPVTRGFQGGITNGPVEIGPLADLQRALVLQDLPYVGLVVLFIAAGFYHLNLFWRRRTLREYLWYGATTLTLAVYTFLGTQLRFSLCEDFVLLKNLEYTALYLIPVVSVEFFFRVFSSPVPRLARFAQVASALLAAGAIATPSLDFNISVLTLWQYSMVAVTVGTFGTALRALRRGHPEARLLIGSFTLLSLAVGNDIFFDQSLIRTAHLVPYAFALFVMSMAGSLANRFARTYSELETLNVDLEERVGAQTLALEERASELESKNKLLGDAYQQLRESSLTDPLTGLQNRRFYQEHIGFDASAVLREHLSPAAKGRPPSLVFFLLDVDHFKRINDGHGHAAGDEVLSQVGSILRSTCRVSDYLVRWGGEEFLVVSRFADRAGAAVLAERLRAAIAEHVFVIGPGLQRRVTASVGFACFPLCESDPAAVPQETVLEVADACLYRVKETGRNGWLGVVRSLGRTGRALRLERGERWTTENLEVASSQGSAG
jgi:diguanylate cyclase (GGDEF)-like protein